MTLGVIAAGGRGTRMAPATCWLNKHLLPVGNGRLMIDCPLDTLRGMGFDQATIVTGCEHAGQVSEYVQDGHDWGFSRVNYEIQPKPAGIGDVVSRVSHLVGENGMFLILGDNYFSVAPCLDLDVKMAVVWEYDVDSKERAKSFGQINRDRFGQPCSIVEKPLVPDHSRIVVGAYFFPQDVVSRVGDLTPSARNELEITSLIEMYLNEKRLVVMPVDGVWKDLGEWSSWREFIIDCAGGDADGLGDGSRD